MEQHHYRRGKQQALLQEEGEHLDEVGRWREEEEFVEEFPEDVEVDVATLRAWKFMGFFIILLNIQTF